MKDIDCYKLMKKCPRFQRCSVALCPLDREAEKRVYLEGEPTCRLDFERLITIADDGLKEQYGKFIGVSLDKGARFKPLNQTAVRTKSAQETNSQK
ncbi:unnamed protein product [marine sediment metagenome]|uniref:Uncharacterized protein n=1 Tax=marine sediment metagenome TaxID=412755 RepID=X0RWV0_9ZZZZ